MIVRHRSCFDAVWRPLLAVMFALATSGLPAGILPLPVEIAADLAVPHSPRLSPDGRWAAFCVSTPLKDVVYDGGFGIRVGRSALNVVSPKSGEKLAIGPVGREAGNPVWSPDGRQLVFQVDEGDAARLWLWTAATRSARMLSDAVPRGFDASPRWTPDGRHIVTAILPEGIDTQAFRERTGEAAAESALPLDITTRGARVAVYRSGVRMALDADGENSSAVRVEDFASNNVHAGDLALIDAGNGSYRRLVKGYRPVSYRISPDGRALSFVHVAGQRDGSLFRTLFDVLVVSLNEGVPKILARQVQQEVSDRMDASWSPDGRWLAYCDSGIGRRRECYRADVRSGQIQVFRTEGREPKAPWSAPQWDGDSKGFFISGEDALWFVSMADAAAKRLALPPGKTIREVLVLPDNGAVLRTVKAELLVLVQDADTKDEGFFAIDILSGGSRLLYEGPSQLSRDAVSTDGKSVLYLVQKVDTSEQVWISDLRFRNPRPLSNLNPQLDEYFMGKSRLVSWYGVAGERLHGALLLPADYQQGHRYPVVVHIYGDERLSGHLNSFGFSGSGSAPFDNMQLLATRGYAVLWADTVTYPGTPMRDIPASFLPGVNKLIEQGIADAERLGVMGFSFGGYSALATIVQTNRFKAAIVTSGMSNLLGGFSQMAADGTAWQIGWAEEGQGKMGGTLWEHRERFIENSPFFYFDRITTPVLVVHGTADKSPKVQMGDEIFQGLRRLGKEVQYARYLDEPHGIVGRANALDYAHRTIAWFDRYLKSQH